MGAYRVTFVIGFVPPLTIARQQQVMEGLESLDAQNLELTPSEASLDFVVQAARGDAAEDEAEGTLARALSAAGHTMSTAPIRSCSVAEVTGPSGH
jgi:hypothetical protein